MNKVKLEYVWLDGYDTPNLRSKSKYVELEDFDPNNIPEWEFDGSSTLQAEGDNSDCILSPVRLYRNPTDRICKSSFVVLCEVMNPDGTPHKSNTRNKLESLHEQYKESEMWFGIEQEYVIMNPRTNRPFGWPEKESPPSQGRYYCGVGGETVKVRAIAEIHAMCCISSGISFSGTNAEVMLSQWEYQIGPKSALDICDELWVSRYFLEIIAENNGASINLAPKPIQGDWNGSIAHINFSTKKLHEKGGKEYSANMDPYSAVAKLLESVGKVNSLVKV